MSKAKNWVFTINNYRQLVEFNDDMQYLVYQEEEGEAGTPHLQGYVEFKDRKRLTQVKTALNAPTAHCEVRRGSAAQARRYSTKAETRIAGPYEFGELAAGQGKRNDFEDFITAVNDGLTRDDALDAHPNILARYRDFADQIFERARASRLPDRPAFIPRAGWQSDLAAHLATEPDARKVSWYCDTTGNTGKSHFSHNYRHEGERPYVITGGKQADIFYGYAFQRVVIFDWARDAEDRFPYGVVEAFKNGYFLGTKYQSRPVEFQVPHVVIFSNFQPDLSKLSQDRWSIHNIRQI